MTTRAGVKEIIDAIADEVGVHTQVLIGQMIRAHCGEPCLAVGHLEGVYEHLAEKPPSSRTDTERWVIRLSDEERYFIWSGPEPELPGYRTSLCGRMVYVLSMAASLYDPALLVQLRAGDLIPRRGRPPGVRQKKSHDDAISG